MAQVTQLNVMGLPGRVRTFSAKTESAFSITYLEPIQVAKGQWVIRWTSTSAGPFRVFKDGKRYAETYQTRIDVYVEEDDEAPFIEVLADPAATPTTASSARQTIRWANVGNPAYYQVQQKIDAVWTDVEQIRNTGASVYAYRTDTLDDDALHEFRVHAVAADGTAGTNKAVSRYSIRHPDPPDDAIIVYDESTGKVAVEDMV